MQIIIKSKQVPVTPQLRQRIERKVQRLARLVGEESRVEVTVTEEQTRSLRDRFSVQLTLAGGSFPVRSEVSALNATTALDLVLDKVVAQIGRQKSRKTVMQRHRTVPTRVFALSRAGLLSSEGEQELSPESEASLEEHNEEIWSRVLEIRRQPTRPMTDHEVIEQMEESGATFYPFFNEATDSVNVMYKLDEGGYGLLVPTLEK